jgi:nucleotide-binding universal stress UspA family protein
MEHATKLDQDSIGAKSGNPVDRPGLKLVGARTRVVLRNILMAIDFSPASDAALNYAIAIARRYGSRIYMTHIIRPDVYQLVSPDAMESVLEQARRYAEQQMAKVLVSGRVRGIPHQVLLGQGEMWTILSQLIDEHEIDMIVVGTHGRTGLKKMLMGSVAERVFRLAPCPVLTVGPKVLPEAAEEAEPRRILYATDFSPSAAGAAPYALSLAQEQQSNLTLLHVLESERGSESVKSAEAVDRLKSLVPPQAALWCAPEYRIGYGRAADEILKTAEDMQADLIVMGARHPDFSLNQMPPATAYKVVCWAHCPVLTVRG